jgi:hypothetical protein
MLVHWDSATVIGDTHGAILVDHDDYILAESGHGLVDSVVDDFLDEMVETSKASRTDVHARPLAYRGKAFHYLNFLGGVTGGWTGHMAHMDSIFRPIQARNNQKYWLINYIIN